MVSPDMMHMLSFLFSSLFTILSTLWLPLLFSLLVYLIIAAVATVSLTCSVTGRQNEETQRCRCGDALWCLLLSLHSPPLSLMLERKHCCMSPAGVTRLCHCLPADLLSSCVMTFRTLRSHTNTRILTSGQSERTCGLTVQPILFPFTIMVIIRK